MYRVIQWASGSLGRTALRRIIDHPDLELVGLYVYDAAKAGLDAGLIAKRPATGILATRDIDRILALDADVVLHTPRLSMPYDAQNRDVERLLGSGKNVISTAGFHFPQAHGESYAGPLRAACRRGNATLAGMGLNPGFLVERLALVLSGLCARIDEIDVSEVADASHMPSPEFVFDTMGFGADPAELDLSSSDFSTLYSTLYGEVFAAAAQALGTRVETVAPLHRVTIAKQELRIAAGVIPAGRVAATEWCWQARLADGPALRLSILWTAAPEHTAALATGAHWRIQIRGRPSVNLAFDFGDEPGMPPLRATTDAAVAVAVRAIPDVCAAPPGFFSYPAPAPFCARFAPRA